MSTKTPALAVTPHPLGKPGGPGLFRIKGESLPPYVENIAHALMDKRGLTKSRAIEMALGVVERWKDGGGKVSPEVRAAAAKAWAAWLASRAKARAIPNKSDHTNDTSAVELAGDMHQWKHGWVPLTPYATAVKAKHVTGSTKGKGPGLPKGMERRAPRDMSDEELKAADSRMEEERKKAGLYSITGDHRAVKAELGRRWSEKTRKETRSRAGKKAAATRKRRAEQGQGPKRSRDPFNQPPPGGWTDADKVPPEHQRPKAAAAKAKPAEPERKPFKDLAYMLAKRDTEMAALTPEERKVYDAANLRPSTEHERSYEGKGPMVQRTIFLTKRHEIGMRAVRAHRNAPRFAKYSDEQLRSLLSHVEKGVKGRRARLHFEIRAELNRRGARCLTTRRRWSCRSRVSRPGTTAPASGTGNRTIRPSRGPVRSQR